MYQRLVIIIPLAKATGPGDVKRSFNEYSKTINSNVRQITKRKKKQKKQN